MFFTFPHHWVHYAVAQDGWKLSVNSDDSHVELYDLVADPLESTDLSDSNPEVVSELKQKLESWKSTLPAKPTGSVFSKERQTLAK